MDVLSKPFGRTDPAGQVEQSAAFRKAIGFAENEKMLSLGTGSFVTKDRWLQSDCAVRGGTENVFQWSTPDYGLAAVKIHLWTFRPILQIPISTIRSSNLRSCLPRCSTAEPYHEPVCAPERLIVSNSAS
jgi:hypothetical protein